MDAKRGGGGRKRGEGLKRAWGRTRAPTQVKTNARKTRRSRFISRTCLGGGSGARRPGRSPSGRSPSRALVPLARALASMARAPITASCWPSSFPAPFLEPVSATPIRDSRSVISTTAPPVLVVVAPVVGQVDLGKLGAAVRRRGEEVVLGRVPRHDLAAAALEGDERHKVCVAAGALAGTPASTMLTLHCRFNPSTA